MLRRRWCLSELGKAGTHLCNGGRLARHRYELLLPKRSAMEKVLCSGSGSNPNSVKQKPNRQQRDSPHGACKHARWERHAFPTHRPTSRGCGQLTQRETQACEERFDQLPGFQRGPHPSRDFHPEFKKVAHDRLVCLGTPPRVQPKNSGAILKLD